MRLVAVLLVVAGLLAGVGAAQSFRSASTALAHADENAQQLVRLQEIQTRLVSADANATNAFLVGGLEPVDQRREYDEAVARATELIAFAARAQPADGEVLAALNGSVQRYTSEIERARAANRQGFPLGAQYLRNAGAALRADAVPQLAALTAANEERTTQEFAAARGAGTAVVLLGLLALLAVGAAGVWLAFRTHRYLNAPLVVAGVLLLGLVMVSGSVMDGIGSTVESVQAGSYAQSRALATARIAAFDAKANESLTLVSRGSGARFEEAWLASATTAQEAIGMADATRTGSLEAASAWNAYADLHREIRALDDGGAWEQAVSTATDRADGTANAAFSAFDEASGARLTEASEATSSALREAQGGLGQGMWLGILAGLAVAALAWRGMSQRIEEYR